MKHKIYELMLRVSPYIGTKTLRAFETVESWLRDEDEYVTLDDNRRYLKADILGYREIPAPYNYRGSTNMQGI